MPSLLKWFVLLLGFSFSGIVIYLLTRKKINEKNTLVWLGGTIIILVLSVNPHLLDSLAKIVDVDYPPSLLFLFSVMVLLLLNLYQSIQISSLHDKIKELSQYIALRDAEDHTGRREHPENG
ncbi:DUF2304 domain-containing protein [Paenibacillus hamazuiensis]|uniref:DUF2304 domain-containing protein n=1 Tax=Paenibacillus hamazuiensis TaxID=2936508 RepID=UPI00200D60CE|nr:DUF2304 domain-containing protein [Paenibacillus hamazuiensis]